MADFRLPGMEQPLAGPQSFVTGVLRNFREAAQDLGAAVEVLVVRLAKPEDGTAPDYQIQTADGEDAAVFNGETHELKYEDITIHLEEDQLSDQTFSAEDVKTWLNIINGEDGGSAINPILEANWTEGDSSDARE